MSKTLYPPERPSRPRRDPVDYNAPNPYPVTPDDHSAPAADTPYSTPHQSRSPTQTSPDGSDGQPIPTDTGRPTGQDHTKVADRDRELRETPVVNPEPHVPEPGPTRHGDQPPSSKKK